LASAAVAGAAFTVATAIAAEGISLFVVWRGGGGGSEALWCCSRKKGKKANVSTQKAHKYCHQFERRVVQIAAIDLFKSARSLHEILGH
jgi:hypothetical protein